MPKKLRRIAFWSGVVGVAALTPFGFELAATKFPNSGFAKFVAFSHKGVS